ncbi:hypothetical protein SanaruYs_38980 [Chryseotalea sanaruensis]|uniref:Viral A-type inclusion protein n=1 Tax=Chryseotalea sanaruensis TaxID=2482724 RepID=A0A401UFI2_9BACT|nr:hypothetical protein [Chryseotalea sanaruensis]GCC53653.1 hypothetical protein SanaruYs_38980 [Chryseotalea sanaruensis]
MKHLFFFFAVSVLIVNQGCNNKAEHDHHETEVSSDANGALYDEVMKIHDEVMPKMNDLYKTKEALKKQIADTPNITEEKRKELEDKISKIEAASKSMMVWMREFNPPADSLGDVVVKEYLEDQLETVKKVKENILEVMPAEKN